MNVAEISQSLCEKLLFLGFQLPFAFSLKAKFSFACGLEVGISLAKYVVWK